MIAGSDLPTSVEFGRFRVLPYRRELLANGQPVKLGGRAFDVLMALIEARGAVVTKDALMQRVRHDRIVEENNLQSHISALRAVLGPDRDVIRTVSGRGYQFIGEIRAVSERGHELGSLGPVAAEHRALPPTNVPQPVSELIGRDDELGEVVNLMGAHRLVTLTGAGGIGKTRLAVAAARALRQQFADGVWLAQFSPLADPKLVPAAVAIAVGLELTGGASVESVAQALAGRRLLLVLDTCEHVIGVAASMAEAALGAGSELRVLATSREALKAEGEWIYPVPPLAVPTADAGHNGFIEYGAIRLFLERAKAADPRLAADQALIELIAATCRRLDGLPLAIEFAAARAAMFGPELVLSRLDKRFEVLIGGRRTALPRHQTLRATLDWSYDLLPESERCLLRRLGVFAGGFTLEAANAVMSDEGHSAPFVLEQIANLVAKSLVTLDGSAPAGRWRLLDTIRDYALEKLAESGETEQVARRCAEFFRDLVQPAMHGSQVQPTIEDMARYGREIDNVRASLDWSFSSSGDVAIGVVLTAAYAPVWLNLSLVAECRERIERALDRLESNSNVSPTLTMKLHVALHVALSVALLYTMGSVERLKIVLAKAFDAAERLGDVDATLEILVPLFNVNLHSGECREALSVAEQFERLALRIGDPALALSACRRIGHSLYYAGKQREAKRCFERVIEQYVAPANHRYSIWTRYDLRLTTRAMLAPLLWLQGFVDQGVTQAQASLEEAQVMGDKLTLCWVLRDAAYPVALMTGDFVVAGRVAAMLKDLATSLGAPFWEIVAQCLEGKLLIRRGEFGTGSILLRTALHTCETTGWTICHPEFLGALAEGLAGLGRLTEALATIDRALAAADRGGERWFVAELLRTKGEILLYGEGDPSIVAAERCFSEALDVAREQGALSWELRTALSFARLRVGQDRQDDARQLLAPVYNRFTEGFETPDLRSASEMLQSLPSRPAELAR